MLIDQRGSYAFIICSQCTIWSGSFLLCFVPTVVKQNISLFTTRIYMRRTQKTRMQMTEIDEYSADDLLILLTLQATAFIKHANNIVCPVHAGYH